MSFLRFIGAILIGFSFVLLAHLAGMIAHDGLLPNGNPANPYAMFMTWIAPLIFASGIMFLIPG